MYSFEWMSFFYHFSRKKDIKNIFHCLLLFANNDLETYDLQIF